MAVAAGAEYDTEPNSDQQAAALALLTGPDVDLGFGHHVHVVQPLQKISENWVIYGLWNNIAAPTNPVDGTHLGLLVRVTFGRDSTGGWTTSDVSWGAVPARRRAALPLVPTDRRVTCTSPDTDAAAVAAATHAVNLYGADTDGAHP